MHESDHISLLCDLLMFSALNDLLMFSALNCLEHSVFLFFVVNLKEK